MLPLSLLQETITRMLVNSQLFRATSLKIHQSVTENISTFASVPHNHNSIVRILDIIIKQFKGGTRI